MVLFFTICQVQTCTARIFPKSANMPHMDIRDRIRARLDVLGKSPRAASLDAGLNTHFLQKYLSPKNPNHSIKVENLIALAPVLETSPEWLLSGIGANTRDPELSAVINIWDRIPQRDQETARRMLEGLAKGVPKK